MIWPNRVLITNDDEIDREEIIQLAQAFSQVAETYVVAPLDYLYESGYIVIVPMRVDEHDREALSRLKEKVDSLPEWRQPDTN